MTAKLTKKYFCKIIESLNECDIVLQKDPRIGDKVVGGHYLNGVITMRDRPERENMVLTLIHEALHHLYPEMPELGYTNSGGEACDLLARSIFCELSTKQLEILNMYLVWARRNGNGKKRKPKRSKKR